MKRQTPPAFLKMQHAVKYSLRDAHQTDSHRPASMCPCSRGPPQNSLKSWARKVYHFTSSAGTVPFNWTLRSWAAFSLHFLHLVPYALAVFLSLEFCILRKLTCQLWSLWISHWEESWHLSVSSSWRLFLHPSICASATPTHPSDPPSPSCSSWQRPDILQECHSLSMNLMDATRLLPLVSCDALVCFPSPSKPSSTWTWGTVPVSRPSSVCAVVAPCPPGWTYIMAIICHLYSWLQIIYSKYIL